MPPLVVLALAGAGAFVAARFVKREMARVAESLAAANQPARKPVEIKLDRDPTSGVYRLPKGPGEV